MNQLLARIVCRLGVRLVLVLVWAQATLAQSDLQAQSISLPQMSIPTGARLARGELPWKSRKSEDTTSAQGLAQVFLQKPIPISDIPDSTDKKPESGVNDFSSQPSHSTHTIVAKFASMDQSFPSAQGPTFAVPEFRDATRMALVTLKPPERIEMSRGESIFHNGASTPNEELPLPAKTLSVEDDWKAKITYPSLSSQRPLNVSLATLIPAALQYSQQIRVVQLDKEISSEQIIQTDAQFDWRVFAQNLWNNSNRPTGSQLDGGQNLTRLKQETLTTDGGLRRTNRVGGKMEASQNIQLQQSNSQFLDPPNQALTKMTLRYNQPLLKNGGRLVNEGQVIIAQLNADARSADTFTKVNEIVMNVSRAYWEIYRRRAEYCIQESLVASTKELLADLKRRYRIDAQKSVIAQTESQLATQLAELRLTLVNIQRAQNELVRQVGDQSLEEFDELIPTDAISDDKFQFDLDSAFSIAMQNRGEIRTAMANINRSEVSRDIAMRQLLPELALIMEASAAGVNGDFAAGKSFGDQFSEGSPSGILGISFDFPLGNRSQKSQARQASLVLGKDIAFFNDTTTRIRKEVKDSFAALTGYGDQMDNRRNAVELSAVEVDALLQRRLIFPSEFDQVSQLLISQYLLALQRRAAAQQAQLNTQVEYAIALLSLRFTVGIILNVQNPGI